MRPSTLVLLGGFSCNAIARGIPPRPITTAAPDSAFVDLRLRQAAQAKDINPFSLARVLLTALPPSLIEVAFTNPGAVPSILWRQFLDQSTPAWFNNLPPDIKTYLSEAYLGPATSVPASATPPPPPIRPSSASAIRPPPSEPPPTRLRSSSQQAPTSARVSSRSTRAIPTVSIPTSSRQTTFPAQSSASVSTAVTSFLSSASVSTDVASSLSSVLTDVASSQSSVSTQVTSFLSSESADTTSISTVSPTTSVSETALPTSLSKTLTPSSKAQATITPAPVPPVPEAAPASGGLSTGSKILIGLGVPLALLAIAAIAIFTICARRRRRQRGMKKLGDQPPPAFLTASQLHGDRGGGGNGMGDGDDGFGTHSTMELNNDTGLLIPYPPAATYTNDLPGNPFRDSHSNAVTPPEQQANETTPFVWPNAQKSQRPPLPPLRTQRHQSLKQTSLEAITEVPDDSPVLGVVGRAKRRGSHDTSPISPVTPTTPQYSSYYDVVSNLQHPAFRNSNGSGHSYHNNYGLVPRQADLFEDPMSDLPSSHAPTMSVRRKSLPRSSGGYRGLPSPHLERKRSPLQRLPPGEYIDDSEIWPLRASG